MQELNCQQPFLYLQLVNFATLKNPLHRRLHFASDQLHLYSHKLPFRVLMECCTFVYNYTHMCSSELLNLAKKCIKCISILAFVENCVNGQLHSILRNIAEKAISTNTKSVVVQLFFWFTAIQLLRELNTKPRS